MDSKDSLFSNEEKYLAFAQALIENGDDESTEWSIAFQEMTAQYAKLLKQTAKLVKISDHAQKSLQLANSRIQQMADSDNLTGLPNRRGSLKLIEQEISKSLRYGTPLSLFLVDIDHFKKINDTWGHGVGDLVLQKISELMKENLRNHDLLGRWGGEEFIIALADTDLTGAETLSEKLRNKIEKSLISIEKAEISFTASFGGTIYSHDMSLEKNIDLADKALYRSKRAGRNRISMYES
ncbi:MAG: GGDEF domain-containing protein [Spirochaetales bacterium]|nr:GGDEF domain-containing protein [Spirochaetales bacterium]